MKALATLFLSSGVVLASGSLARWANVYNAVLLTIYAFRDAHPCLYGRGMCNALVGGVQLFGISPYPPQWFLIGLGLISLGILSRLSARLGY